MEYFWLSKSAYYLGVELFDFLINQKFLEEEFPILQKVKKIFLNLFIKFYKIYIYLFIGYLN
jgi:hypothetical protein